MPTKRKRGQGRPHGLFSLAWRGVLGLILLVALAVCGPNVFMFAENVFDIESAEQMQADAESYDADAIIVLGASVKSDGSPSAILKDRLDTAIDLYKRGVAPKLIMSGDNSDSHYNEVMNMTNYAISQGVDRDDIFCDHAGINTYDSMYRAKYVFQAIRLVVVTNEYHLYRSMFLSKSFGVDARGVASDKGSYTDMAYYEQREFMARVKDFYGVLTNVEPSTYSDTVSLTGSGTVTQWWKKSSEG